MLLNLLLGQPLEVDDVLDVAIDLGLAGHDAALEEEGLLAEQLGAGLGVVEGTVAVVDVVADGVVSDHPLVHIGAGGLEEGAFGSLNR